MEKPTKRQRLSVYKKALTIVSKKRVCGLCFLLRNIELGLPVYETGVNDIRMYRWYDTLTLFPEFGKYGYLTGTYGFNPTVYESLYLDANNNNKGRIKILKEIISKMESK